MLRKRLQLLTTREIENQKRLETFSRFAPLFDALDTYSSPADALRRLSVLEKESGSTFAEARQAEEHLKDATDHFTDVIKKNDATISELKVKLLQASKKSEAKIHELEHAVHTSKQDVLSLQSFREKYLTTQTAIQNCYERALRAAAVLDVGDPRISMASEKNIADVGYPLQMLEHVGLLFEASNPTKAGMRVHMLTGTINRMWLDLTGQKVNTTTEIGNEGQYVNEGKRERNEGKRERNEGKRERNEGGKKNTPTSKGHGSTPDPLLFRPEDILKMVGQKINAVKIREKNTLAKLNTTQLRLVEAQHQVEVEDKKNGNIELELDRLRRLLKKN